MISDILANATGSVIGAIVTAALGIGAVTTTVVIVRRGGRLGKNIIIFAAILFFGGMYYAGEHQAPAEVGISILVLSLFIYWIGKFINWYQH